MPKYMSAPIRLADLDVGQAAIAMVGEVVTRTWRDARRLGFRVTADPPPVPGQDQTEANTRVLLQSDAFHAAHVVTKWAKTGDGTPHEIAAWLIAVRADLEGIDPAQATPKRTMDPDTVAGVIVLAAGARLALAEGRTISAVELATLASVDERTVRAAVTAGTLRPVGAGRPMRFAAEAARMYLYARGVPGFTAA